MSPASVMHVIFQGKIMALLNRYQQDSLVVPEFPVETRDGIKVVGVGLLTNAQVARLHNNISAAFVPILCIEVLSPSNTLAEMEHKKELYFEKGAEEFWTCDQTGQMRFHDKSGELATSVLFQQFPTHINH